jgi:hypothetical protein
MRDLRKEALKRIASCVEHDTRKLLEDAIAKRLGAPVVKFEDYLTRMRTIKAGASTLVYLDQKELIAIGVLYHYTGSEYGYEMFHRHYEAPNVH